MMHTQVELENIAIVRRGFEAFNAGDVKTLTDLIDPSARWHGPPAGVFGPEYQGRDRILPMLAQYASETGGTFHAIPSETAAVGDKVFVREIITGKRNNRSLEQDAVLVFALRQGRVYDVRAYISDPTGFEAFWS